MKAQKLFENDFINGFKSNGFNKYGIIKEIYL
jgi:hypothetical protein